MKDYKSIWDHLSPSMAEASFYVCSVSDEEEIRRNGVITAEFLRSVLQIEQTDLVLEIGCGVARVGRELAPYCGEWHGADISGNMIAFARERTSGMGNVFLHELLHNNLEDFEDSSFDALYSTIVFMHLDKADVFNYICEAYRVLKPGGIAYFDTYNLLAPDAWREFERLAHLYPTASRPGHVSQFSTEPEFRRYMTQAGFVDIEIDQSNNILLVGVCHKSETAPARAPVAEVEELPALAPPTAQGLELIQRLSDPREELIGKLVADLERKNEYLGVLESELGRKNAALTELEQRLRAREAELVVARRPRLPWKRGRSRGK